MTAGTLDNQKVMENQETSPKSQGGDCASVLCSGETRPAELELEQRAQRGLQGGQRGGAALLGQMAGKLGLF